MTRDQYPDGVTPNGHGPHSTDSSDIGWESSSDHPSNEDEHDRLWLSHLIGLLWNPELRRAFEKLAWEMLPDLLQQSIPPWMQSIKLEKFKLGHHSPKFSNFKSFKNSDRTDDAMVAVECDIDWHSESDVRLRIKPIPKQLTFIPTALSTVVSNMVSFQAGVKRLHVKGRIRITFDPLVDHLPVIGAVKISFVAQPDTVDFQVEVMGGQTLSGLIPSLKAWIIGFARESLISLYVMPEHWVYRLDPSIKDVTVPEGTLKITIVEAEHIPKGDYIQDASPYVEMWVRASQKRRTSIQPVGKSATWNESFVLPVHMAEHQQLECTLYDHDQMSADDELGKVRIPIKDLPEDEEQDLWLDVEDPKEAIKQDQRQQQHDPVAGAMKRVHNKQEKKPSCRMHIRVTYHSMDKDEMHAIAKAQTEGDMDLLYKHPSLKGIARQGIINIKLNYVDRLGSPNWWRGTHKHVRVKCMYGDDVKHSQLRKGDHHGCRLDETIQLEVSGDKPEGQEGDDIIIEVHDTKWWQKNVEGRMVVKLSELKKHTKMAGKKKLQQGSSPNGRLDLEMQWDSYLGSDDQGE